MTSTQSTQEETIFKTDGRGRVRVPAERREALLDEFERSGLSGMKFAQLTGVKYATFANWVQKRRRARATVPVGVEQTGGAGAEARAASARSGPMRLFEAFAEIEGSARGGGLHIELPGGARMHVESPTQLRLTAELLRMLAQTGGRAC
jgi:hypothetical protein